MTLIKRKPSERYKSIAQNAMARLGDTDAIIDAINDIQDGTSSFDTISEKTAGHGVIVDGVLLKDSEVAAANGSVADPSVHGTALNSGIFFNTSIVGFSTAGSHSAKLVGDGSFVVSSSSVTGGFTTDVASSQVPVLITGAPETITAGTGGAISIAGFFTDIAVDADGDAFTLAAGSVPGQVKKILLSATGGGTGVVTGVFRGVATTLTFTNAGEFAVLMWDGSAWLDIELSSVSTLTHKPVLS